MNFVIMTAKTFWKRELIRALVRGDLRYTATRFRWCKRWRIAVSPALHLTAGPVSSNRRTETGANQPRSNRRTETGASTLSKMATLTVL
jgi:hypothetical protein